MKLPNKFTFYAQPSSWPTDGNTLLYTGEVQGTDVVVSWRRMNFHEVRYPAADVAGYIERGEWVLVDNLDGVKTTPVHERLRSIARDMSYGDCQSEAAGKHRLFELADDLERGTAHVKAVPDPAPLEQVLSIAREKLYDITIYPDKRVVLQSGLIGGEHHSRVTVDNAEQALKWFDLKAQLEALEQA